MAEQTENQDIIFDCMCDTEKIYRLVFDGDSTGNYVVEYCQKCYDSDDKQFMISMDVIN